MVKKELESLRFDNVNKKIEEFKIADKNYLSDAVPVKVLQKLIAQYADEYILCITFNEINGGHGEKVDILAYHPSGRYLASIAKNFQIKIWNIDIMECIHTIEAKKINYYTRALSFSPDGRYLTFGSYYSDICIWDINEKKFIDKFSLSSNPDMNLRSLAYDPSDRYLAIGSYGMIIIYDLENSKYIQLFNSPNNAEPILTLTYSPDGKYLVSGSCDKCISIKIWDIKTKQCIQTCDNSDGIYIYDMFALVFNLNGSLFVISPSYIKKYKKIRLSLLAESSQNKVEKNIKQNNSCVIQKTKNSCIIS